MKVCECKMFSLPFAGCVFSHQIPPSQKSGTCYSSLGFSIQDHFVRNIKDYETVSLCLIFGFVISFIFKLLLTLYFSPSPTLPNTSDSSLFLRLINNDSTAQRYGTLQYKTSKFELTYCNKNCTFLCWFQFLNYRVPKRLKCLTV